MFKSMVLFLTGVTWVQNANAQMLNEILTNPNGSDSNCEFVEIRGNAGDIMDNIYFMSVEGDASSTVGAADRVVDLTGLNLGTNGLMVITNDLTGDCTRTYNVPTTTRVSAEGFSMENGTTSFLLVFSPVVIVESTDYDLDNDGVLELDENAMILDAIAFNDGGSNDVMFGNVQISTDFGSAADMATRFFDNTNANDPLAWVYGDMDGANTSVMYDPTQVSNNYTPLFTLTPGGENPSADLIYRSGFETQP